jgi:hypothetical protein
MCWCCWALFILGGFYVAAFALFLWAMITNKSYEEEDDE